MNGICRCGKTYQDCKYPVSHNHPSISSVKLPAAVTAATSGKRTATYGKNLTSAQRAVMNDFQP
jgi:hypothetical protein